MRCLAAFECKSPLALALALAFGFVCSLLFLVAGQDLRCVWLICSLALTTTRNHHHHHQHTTSLSSTNTSTLPRSSSGSNVTPHSLTHSLATLRSQLLLRLSEKLRSLDSFATLRFLLGFLSVCCVWLFLLVASWSIC